MTAPQPWPTTRLCPATSNLPTRMLASTWQTLCTAMQRREAVDGRRGWKGGLDFYEASAARFPCAMCQGRTLPPGLELITQEEAEQMARTTKRGTCELCGVHANVGMNHGSMVCNNCTHLQSAVANRLPAVAAAAQAMRKTEDLLGHLIPAGGLAVKVTADLLQEISGIVGYDGEDPAELVAAVRKRVLTCASCDAEDVLHEIREIVGYSADMGDSGLAEAVRAFEDRRPAGVPDCAACDAAEALLEIADLVGKRGASSGLVVEAVREVAASPTTSDSAPYWADLMRACGIEDDGGPAVGWLAVAAAIQTIAEIEYFYRMEAARFLVALEDEQRKQAVIRNDTARLYEEKINRANAAFLHTVGELKDEIARLNGQTHSESAEMTELRADLEGSEREIVRIRSQLTLAQQSSDEWEQRAVQAESNVETLEAELRDRKGAPSPCASTTYLLDIALRALRGEGPDADQLATLLEAARRAA